MHKCERVRMFVFSITKAMIPLIILVTAILLLVLMPGGKKCSKCGSKNVAPMGHGIGWYCGECFKRFE